MREREKDKRIKKEEDAFHRISEPVSYVVKLSSKEHGRGREVREG